ncbi:MAG: hypothetical protein V7L25_30380 [Nostoc sp.]
MNVKVHLFGQRWIAPPLKVIHGRYHILAPLVPQQRQEWTKVEDKY